MIKTRIRLWSSVLLVVASGPLVAGVLTDPPLPDATAEATFTEVDPTLDGDVLGDAGYEVAKVITGFTQNTPDEGQPASERTEVRVVYTATTIYVGVICYDGDPGGVMLSQGQRDESLTEADAFQMIFDTFDDDQNGFVFGTTPTGSEYDAQVSNDGQGDFVAGRFAGGAIGGFNINWDAAWDVVTKVDDDGWTAEFAIPVKTLRFPRSRGPQTWGVNFQRTIRRRNEVAFWSPLPRQFELKRVSMAGAMTGLNLVPPRNLKVIPYALGNVVSDDGQDARFDAGVDVKYSITPSLTLDGTYNTDFAQVEVDDQQVNLDRFSLFFPEKRPFFLENAGLFSVGAGGEIDMFFSRRIGISEDGQTIPILGGGRLSGRVGSTSIGFLNMQTRSVDLRDDDLDADVRVPGNNYTVARVRQEFGRSSIGALFTNRLGVGDGAPENDYGRTVAIDGKVALNEVADVSAFLASTPNADVGEGAYAFGFKTDINSEKWLLNATYNEVGEGFNPEVGFLARTSYRKFSGLIFRTIRPENLIGLHEIRPHVSYRGWWELDGFHETGFLHVDSHWEFKNGYEIHTGVNFKTEGVREPFQIFPGVVVEPGTYDDVEAQIVAWTDQSADLVFNYRGQIGGFFGGTRIGSTVTVSGTLNDKFTAQLSLNRNDISLPGGDFTTNLLGSRLAYFFSPRLFIQGLVQYNDRVDLMSTNIRFGWLQASNTGLFLVYNNLLDTADGGEAVNSFTIKYSRIFDVLN